MRRWLKLLLTIPLLVGCVRATETAPPSTAGELLTVMLVASAAGMAIARYLT